MPTDPTSTDDVPGLRHYRINGQPVGQEEFERRLAVAQTNNLV